MKEFDIYKWNSERRLAAVNESVEEAVQPSIMYDLYDGLVAEMGDTFKAEFASATEFERRMRKYTEQISEGAMDRDQIAQKLFGKDCTDLDAEQLKKVDTEYKKDTHNK